VRVFTIVFNDRNICIRVHRAEKPPITGEPLQFCFDEFVPPIYYTKDQACLLVETILTNYAASKLHPALKNTFVEIVNQGEEYVASKQNTSVARDDSTKQTRGRHSTG
jgi:hypothetical protein